MNDDLERAERYQRLFVRPIVDQLKIELEAHIAPLVTAQQDQRTILSEHGRRIGRLEGSQKKALIGFGFYASIASIAVGAGWNWIKGKIKIG